MDNITSMHTLWFEKLHLKKLEKPTIETCYNRKYNKNWLINYEPIIGMWNQ